MSALEIKVAHHDEQIAALFKAIDELRKLLKEETQLMRKRSHDHANELSRLGIHDLALEHHAEDIKRHTFRMDNIEERTETIENVIPVLKEAAAAVKRFEWWLIGTMGTAIFALVMFIFKAATEIKQ
jgi:Cdc6-like AAA superfamily ATPase